MWLLQPLDGYEEKCTAISWSKANPLLSLAIGE